MISRTRLVLVVISSLALVSLLWLLPVFAATGAVQFIDPTDATQNIAWVHQSGQVGLQVTDSDLDVAVKRVLLPVDMTENAATATVVAGSSAMTLNTSSTMSIGATTTPTMLSPGDSILVDSETVRLILSVDTSTSQITMKKPFNLASTSAAVFKVTQALASAAACPACAAAQRVTVANTGNVFFALDSVPISDTGSSGNPFSFANRFAPSPDTVVNTNDAVFTDATGASVANTITVQFVNDSTGMVNVASSQANFTFYALYWGAAANDTGATVKVTSQVDPTGITVVLTESGPITGKFRLNILATSSASNAAANPPQLMMAANDVITLKYTDVSPSVTITTTLNVESTAPVFSNLIPAHGSSGQSNRPIVEGDMFDAGSAVDSDTIRVIFVIDDDDDGVIDNTLPPQVVDANSLGVVSSISGGNHVRQQLPSGMAPSSDATVYWWLKGDDRAGNIAVSDRQPTNDSCDSEAFATFGASLVGKDGGWTSDVVGCQPFSVRVDSSAPGLVSAVTGSWWDVAKTTTDKTETDAEQSKNTRIRVDFDGDLNGATIQASDFLVAGSAPSAAAWHSGRMQSVFLTVPALAADARPLIDLVAEVQDAAGNPTNTGSIAAAVDGIAPAITVTVTGNAASRPVTTGQVTISLVADEDVTVPVLQVAKVLDASASSTPLATPTVVLVAQIDPLTYQATYTGPSAGLYNVYATASDVTASNQRAVGENTGPIDVTSTTNAVLFEVDTDLTTPILGLANPNDPSGYLVMNFQNEGAEYGLDANGATTTDPSTVTTSYDTHATTTILAATLDAVDILGTLTTSDEILYRHLPSGLTTGAHTVEVTARDAAGNQNQFSETFTVTNLTSVVNAGPDVAVNEGSALAFSQTSYIDANEPDTHTAVVDWGDGVTSTATVNKSGSTGTLSASHVYADDEGSPYTVTITVTDNVDVSDTDSFLVTVNNLNPTVDAGGNQQIATGTVMNLAPATFGDLGVQDTHSALIVWGDGTHDAGTINQNNRTITASHLYATNGQFPVTVIAIGDDGGYSVDTFTATMGSGSSIPTVAIGTVTMLVIIAVALGVLLAARLRRKTASADMRPA